MTERKTVSTAPIQSVLLRLDQVMRLTLVAKFQEQPVGPK